jgi:hypothetical protein
MIFNRCIITLCTCLVLLSCGKTSIVGRWKQLEAEPNDSIPHYAAERILAIAADSTFIFDDGTENDSSSQVPGWHAGGKFSGTWRIPYKKHLELRLEPKDPLMILNYEIIKLTGKELELIFPGWKENPNGRSLRFTRL